MSDADHRNVAMVQQGVSLEKTLNTDDFAVPTIVFSIRAPPDGRTTVRVRDPIPESVEGGDVGFHPNHGGEFWTYEGDHVAFSREFEPGEEYTTVYGIVGADSDHHEWLSAEPTVDLLDGVEASGEDAGSTDDQSTDGDGSADAKPNVLVQLAMALEEGDDDDLRRVRSALFDGEAPPVARIDELRREVDGLAERTRRVEARSEADDRLDDLAAEVASLGERLADLEDRSGPPLVDAGDDVDLDAVRSSVAEVREEVAEVASTVSQAKTGMERNARDIDDIGGELAELTSTVETVLVDPDSPAADDDSLADVVDSIEEIREDLESALAFQERLESTLLPYQTR